MTERRKQNKKQKVIVSVVMACIGLVLFLAVVLGDSTPETEVLVDEQNTELLLRYAVSMALGGGVLGLLASSLFGRRGVIGWIIALFAGALTTLFAGLVGSLIALLPDRLADGWQSSDLFPILSGALIPVFALYDWACFALVLPVVILLVHFWVRSLNK